MKTPRVVIIGNGIAGITAALELRRENSAVNITIISDETELFYSRTALMYVYMRDLQFSDTVVNPREFYKKRKIALEFATVTQVDCEARSVRMQTGKELAFDFLLLAPGSKPRLPGITGEHLDGVQGLYSKAHLDSLEEISKQPISRAVIVGGGLIGVELAEMLTRRKIPVTFLVRDTLYFRGVFPEAEAQIVTDEIRQHGVDLRLGTNMATIEGDANGRVCRVTTATGDRIDCNFVGLTIGVEPRLELTQQTPLRTNRGILTDSYLATNVPGIFAAGDAAEVSLPDGQPQVQQLWYTGRMQGKIAGQNLARAINNKTLAAYDPGIFFNSAKFFNIEYQTYGRVPPDASQADSFLWHDAARQKLIRITFDNKSPERTVTGFNILGIRYRHEVCEKWIREKASLAKVAAGLNEANFDPEFYPQFENHIRSQMQ